MKWLFILRQLLKHGRLTMRLLRDPRVPPYAKLVPIAAIAYAIMPFDVAPDLVPLLGQLDDLAVLGAGLSLFLRLCPPDVVAEHERGDDRGQPRPPYPDYPERVEGSARPVTPR